MRCIFLSNPSSKLLIVGGRLAQCPKFFDNVKFHNNKLGRQKKYLVTDDKKVPTEDNDQ